jgi:hypothetical protein
MKEKKELDMSDLHMFQRFDERISVLEKKWVYDEKTTDNLIILGAIILLALVSFFLGWFMCGLPRGMS